MIYSQLNEKHNKVTHSMQWVYAHGELQNFLGYDNINTDSLTLASEHMKAQGGHFPMYKRSHDEFAMNDEGEIVKIMVFLWRAGGTARGLAVSIHDKEAIAYAYEQFNNRSAML